MAKEANIQGEIDKRTDEIGTQKIMSNYINMHIYFVTYVKYIKCACNYVEYMLIFKKITIEARKTNN